MGKKSRQKSNFPINNYNNYNLSFWLTNDIDYFGDSNNEHYYNQNQLIRNNYKEKLNNKNDNGGSIFLAAYGLGSVKVPSKPGSFIQDDNSVSNNS